MLQVAEDSVATLPQQQVADDASALLPDRSLHPYTTCSGQLYRCTISWFEFGRKESLQLWPIKVGVGWAVLCRGTITDHSNQDWSGGRAFTPLPWLYLCREERSGSILGAACPQDWEPGSKGFT